MNTPHNFTSGTWNSEVVAIFLRDRRALSTMQRVIIQMLAEGQTNKAIAYQLRLQVSTVKSHVAVVMQTLDCSNRTQIALIGFCIRHSLRKEASDLRRLLARNRRQSSS